MKNMALPQKFTGKKPHLKQMLRHIQRSNAVKSVIRTHVEHVFVDQKSQTGLFVQTVGITCGTMRVGQANIVYNMRRFLFLERISATAMQLSEVMSPHGSKSREKVILATINQNTIVLKSGNSSSKTVLRPLQVVKCLYPQDLEHQSQIKK